MRLMGFDGTAILYKDFDSLKKEDVYENNKLAFRVAEEELGIPALLDAEDMVALKVPDRLSILTYVSQYYNFFTGRSPIGGMAHIKRPATDSSEEPAQKRLTPETKPKHPKNTRTANNEPTPHAAPTCRVASVNKVPARDTGDSSSKSGTLSSSCAICKKTVLLVQRYLVDGKLYHRNCFRCAQCTTTLMAGAYKAGPTPGTFICINHSANDREKSSHNYTSPSQPPGSRTSEPAPAIHRPVLSHVSGSAAVTPNSKQPECSPAAPRTGTGLTEGTQAAKQRFLSSVTPEKGSPVSPHQSQDPIRGLRSPIETMTQRPWSPGNQEHASVVVKSPTPTVGPGAGADKEKARAILQKNLPLDDNNNNRSQGSTSTPSLSAERSPGKQPTSYQTTKSIMLSVSSLENGQEGARSSDRFKNKESGREHQAKDSKWRPISSYELSPSLAVGRGATNSEAVHSAATNRTPRTSLNRASSMNEATSRTPTPAQKANTKGNYSYSPQIISRAQQEESPSDWRSKLKPVQKQHSLGPSDAKQIHSSPLSRDVKKPAEFGNALGTPSPLKTTASSIWTSSATRGSTSTAGGNTVEVTFSLQVPGNVSISPSPASPNKRSSPEAGPSQSTQQKKVLKPGPQLLAGARDIFQSPSAADKETGTVAPSENEGSGPLGISYRPALDRVTEEPPGKQTWVQGKSSMVTAREEFFKDVYTSGNDKESKDLAKSTESPQENPPNRRMSEQEIQRELQSIGKKLDALEQKGVELEPQLRVCEGDEREDDLMVEWFKLIHEKQLLMRRESELVYISKQQILEDHQCLIDQELRALMAKAEDQKTDGDRAREQELMEELLKTVEDRNNIIDRLDEDRVREMEEDLMMEAMINKIDINKETEHDLKKKNKFSPLKFMKRLGGKSKGKE
ncbi:MICAL-like protein 2a isoform X2 [Pristis pectinata]|uniref:MICAL-like protein 2a isoform X2 n=1 Tax=Pristis pectinata TaxID=685728 RepID=UPI00223E2D24|nr:MICAL-like protein 2a isoform X2 [Pristis pectinata]